MVYSGYGVHTDTGNWRVIMKTATELLNEIRTNQKQAMNEVLREIATPMDESEMTAALLEDVAAERMEQRMQFEQERQNAMQAEIDDVSR